MGNRATRAFAAGFGESVGLATVLIGGLILAIKRIVANWNRQSDSHTTNGTAP